MATIIDYIYDGGIPNASPAKNSVSSDWSITSGNLVIVSILVRNPSGTPATFSTGTFTQRAAGSADFNGGTPYIYTATNVSGTLTVTPGQTSDSRYTVWIVEISSAAYLDSAVGNGGVFNSSPSLGPTSAMSAAGGIAFWFMHVDAGDEYNVTAPTGLLDVFEANNGGIFRCSANLNAETRTSGQTSSLTGTATTSDVGVFSYGWTLAEDSGGGATKSPLGPRRRMRQNPSMWRRAA